VNQGGVLQAVENEPVALNPAQLVALASADRKRRQEAAAAPAASPAGMQCRALINLHTAKRRDTQLPSFRGSSNADFLVNS
jgi:hypothetical protein